MRSLKLKELLGIFLPEDYKKFIDEIGYLSLGNISIEVYGYKPDFDINKIPCVVAATTQNKDDYNLKDHEIVISHTGFEDYIVILDCISGFVYEVNLSGDRKRVAECFSDWLDNLIIENTKAGQS